MNRGRQVTSTTPTYVKQVSEILRVLGLSILQQLNLQAHNLTQLIQLEH